MARSRRLRGGVRGGRDLCLLALEIAIGGASAELSAAYCGAARAPTAHGRYQALAPVIQLVDDAGTVPSDPTAADGGGTRCPNTKRAA